MAMLNNQMEICSSVLKNWSNSIRISMATLPKPSAQSATYDTRAKLRWDALCSNQMCHCPRHTPTCAAKGILRHQPASADSVWLIPTGNNCDTFGIFKCVAMAHKSVNSSARKYLQDTQLGEALSIATDTRWSSSRNRFWPQLFCRYQLLHPLSPPQYTLSRHK